MLSAQSRQGAVSVLVADDGPNVADEDAPRLFEPGVTSGANGHGGAGLGLPLARAVGGAVLLDEPSHGGATFRADLPG